MAAPQVIKDRLLDALPDGTVTDLSVRTYEDGAGVDVRFRLDGAKVTASIEEVLGNDYFDYYAAEFPNGKPAGCDASQFPSGHDVDTIRELRDGDFPMDPQTGALCLNWATAKAESACVADAACWEQFYRAFLTDNPCIAASGPVSGCTALPQDSWLYTPTPAGARTQAARYVGREWRIRMASASATLTESDVADIVAGDLWFK